MILSLPINIRKLIYRYLFIHDMQGLHLLSCGCKFLHKEVFDEIRTVILQNLIKYSELAMPSQIYLKSLFLLSSNFDTCTKVAFCFWVKNDYFYYNLDELFHDF